MKHDARIATPVRGAQRALSLAARIVANAPASPAARLQALQEMADHLRRYVECGWLTPAAVADKIFEVAESNELAGEAGSDKEAAVMQIAMSANMPFGPHPGARSDGGLSAQGLPAPPSLETKTPAAWRG